MRRHRLTERQIVSILKEVKPGATVKEIRGRHGVSPQYIIIVSS